jgi:hypothetical protein
MQLRAMAMARWGLAGAGSADHRTARKRDAASSLLDDHRFHFSEARALRPPNKSDVENHVTLVCLLMFCSISLEHETRHVSLVDMKSNFINLIPSSANFEVPNHYHRKGSLLQCSYVS